MSTFIEREQVATKRDVRIAFHLVEDSVRQHLSSHYWNWTRLFESDPNARIGQHPEHIFSETPHLSAAHPIVLCEAYRENQLIALGALVPKFMDWKRAGGIGFSWELSGYRLAGNRFLGETDSDILYRMLSACEEYCRQQGRSFLLIEDLEIDDPLLNVARLISHLGTRLFCLYGWQNRLKIEFPGTPDEYWGRFSSKTRYTMRKRIRKLGEHRLVKVTESSQIAEFLESANEISLRSWQLKLFGVGIQNDDREAALFTFLATHQALRSYLLYVGDRPAAYIFGTQLRGLFSYEQVAYDHSLSERSPGTVLLTLALEDLQQHDPPKVFDFGGGDADYKQIYATSQTTSGTIWLVPPSWRGTFLLAALRCCRAVRRMARGMVTRLGWTTYLRQLIRGKHARVTSASNDSVSDSDKREADGVA